MGLLETAAASLVAGERRLETAARNITNVSTPGYKREIAFSEIAEAQRTGASPVQAPETGIVSLAEQGALVETGNPLDFAINGSAYMLVRSGESFSLTRGGQFSLGADGALVDALGRVLQHAAGGDLSVSGKSIEVLGDGTILDGGVPVGAVGLFDAEGADPTRPLTQEQVAVLVEAQDSELLQGSTEKSNVVLSDEMVRMMSNQRQTEGAAQIVRAYDQLMSQAISTFSRSGS